jgi:glycosyltransferase involved in cell wall biosynthesis
VPTSKIKILSLGADTETFHPVESDLERAARRELRTSLGFTEGDIVCVYTGRFSRDKNPLLLAKAIDSLSDVAPQFKGLFIGDGVQRVDIEACRNTTVVPFMTHRRLSEHYRAADIGVWPRQESMSMIDAAASGVPLVVSDKMGEPDRVIGNGRVYVEDDIASLAEVLRSFTNPEERQAFGAVGRQKMLDGFNWTTFAQTVESDFIRALTGGSKAA